MKKLDIKIMSIAKKIHNIPQKSMVCYKKKQYYHTYVRLKFIFIISYFKKQIGCQKIKIFKYYIEFISIRVV